MPTRSGLLTLADGQTIFWEETGRADGIPALYVHGGPGGTLGKSSYLTKFDLTRFRVIGLEQRGCGRSLPLATDPAHDLSGNTTGRLIEDMESLREHLGVDRWLLNGVSWGSTLALAYALEHPDRVLGIVLMAVTTTSRAEVDWITEGVGAIYPEAWDRFASFAEDAGIGYQRGTGRIVEAYAALVAGRHTALRRAAAEEWALWEDTHVSIGTDGFHRDPRWNDPLFTDTFVRLTTHYWSHDGFCDPPILGRARELAGIPGILIHGRRDLSSPLLTAWDLHRTWPSSELVVDEADGHGGPSMVESWSSANSALADRLT